MIISGGENVYSAEVENAISLMPGVAEVAVIGILDTKWGESVHAIIVPHAGANLTTEAVIAHCRTQIAGYKCPRPVEFRDTRPRRESLLRRVSPTPCASALSVIVVKRPGRTGLDREPQR